MALIGTDSQRIILKKASLSLLLMNNSIYGKTMEKLKDRVDIKHVKNSEGNQKFVFRPIFVSQKMFNKKMIAVHKIKEVLTLNKPVSVDMCILDLSKTLIYDFHYNNYIKKNIVIKLNYCLQTLTV